MPGGLTHAGRTCLARTLGTLRAFDPESPPIRVPLAGLGDADKQAIDALLGGGIRRAHVNGDPARVADETDFAGVWRGRVLSETGESLFDWLEIGDLPGFIGDRLHAAVRDYKRPCSPADIIRAPLPHDLALGAQAATIIDRVMTAAASYRRGRPNVQVFAGDAPRYRRIGSELRERLGDLGVGMQRRAARGVVVATATQEPHIWIVEATVGRRAAFCIEIGDVPAGMRVPAPLFRVSADRLERALEQLAFAPTSAVA